MSMPSSLEQLDYCPKTPGCAKKKLIRDRETAELFFIDSKGDIRAHKCMARTGQPAEIGYQGIWLNRRNGITRFTGPFRSFTSAIRPPETSAGKYRKAGVNTEWQFIRVSESPLTWTPMTLSDEYTKKLKEEGFIDE